MRFKINEMLFHCLDILKVYQFICYTIVKGIGLLRNLLVSAEKLFCCPHDDVTVRKLFQLSFLKQQADKKAFHAGGHLLMC